MAHLDSDIAASIEGAISSLGALGAERRLLRRREQVEDGLPRQVRRDDHIFLLATLAGRRGARSRLCDGPGDP